MILRLAALIFILGTTACAPTVTGSGPAHFPPAVLDERYRTADGTELALQSWLPQEEPQAVVIGLHGYGDYANNFLEMGEDFSAQGIAVYSYDQRGFGRSPTRGFWAGTPTLAEDARALVRVAKQRHPKAPVYLVGISMGGAVAMTAAAALTEQELAGLVLITPAVWGRETLPASHTALLWLVSHAVPALPLTGRGLNRQPTDNIALLRRLWRDPHMTRSTRADMLHGMVDLMDDALAAAPHLTGPMLVLAAGQDEIIPQAPLALLRARLPPATAEKRRFKRYDGGYHMLIRGLNGAEVRNDIARWIIAPASATLILSEEEQQRTR